MKQNTLFPIIHQLEYLKNLSNNTYEQVPEKSTIIKALNLLNALYTILNYYNFNCEIDYNDNAEICLVWYSIKGKLKLILGQNKNYIYTKNYIGEENIIINIAPKILYDNIINTLV